MEEKLNSANIKEATPLVKEDATAVVEAPKATVDEVAEENKNVKETKKRSAGYKVAHGFWIAFQVLSVILFGVAVVTLIISPIFPFITGGVLGKESADASALEQIAYVLGTFILAILGVFVTIGMIAVSLIVNLGSIWAGGIGFLISIIARPKREKWKALVSFGATTILPLILAIVEAIIIVVAVIVFFLLKK